jgi:hypothetical protein
LTLARREVVVLSVGNTVARVLRVVVVVPEPHDTAPATVTTIRPGMPHRADLDSLR